MPVQNPLDKFVTTKTNPCVIGEDQWRAQWVVLPQSFHFWCVVWWLGCVQIYT